MHQNWFAKFRAADFSLDDAPCLSRTVEVDSDQIETPGTITVPHRVWSTYSKYPTIKLLVNMKCVILRKNLEWTCWPTQYFEHCIDL